jgi:hypothetical protein
MADLNIGGANLDRIEEIIKLDYLPLARNQVNTDVNEWYKRMEKVPLKSDRIQITMPYGFNGGVGFSGEDKPTPRAGNQNYINAEIRTCDLYARITVSNKTIHLAKTDTQAVTDAVGFEIEGATRTMKWEIGAAAFGDERGIIAKATAAGTGAVDNNTVVVDSVKYLREGIGIDFYATGATTPSAESRRIKNINRATKTITFDGAAYAAANADFITFQKSYGLSYFGLGHIFGVDYLGNDTGRTTIYGKPLDEYYLWNPVTRDADGTITDSILTSALNESWDIKNSNIDLFMADEVAFNAYTEYSESKGVTVIPSARTFVGGVQGVDYRIGNRIISFVYEPFVPHGEIWGVDTKTWKFHRDEINFETYNGSSIFNPVYETSYMSALMYNYGNIICDLPGGNIRIKNVTG